MGSAVIAGITVATDRQTTLLRLLKQWATSSYMSAAIRRNKYGIDACNFTLRETVIHRDDLRCINLQLEMWANAQRDGRPAEYRWRPLFNAAKFG